MAIAARGVVTLTDVTDGLDTVVIIQTNENHTFPANSSGAVAQSTYEAFENFIPVMIANRQAICQSGVGNPTLDDRYRIQSTVVEPSTALTVQGTVVAIPGIADPGNNIATYKQAVTFLTEGQTTSVTQITIRTTIRVRVLGQYLDYVVVTTLSKAVGGTAESLVLSASKQTFLFEDFTATSPIPDDITNPAIVLIAGYDGPLNSSGNITWLKSINGAAETSVIPDVSPAPTPTQSQVTVTRTDFGTSNYITYRASKGSVTDRVSIFRVDRGQASYTVSPEVINGSLNFKNNVGEVTLRARVYKGGEEITSNSGWLWEYYMDGVKFAKRGVGFNTGSLEDGYTSAQVTFPSPGGGGQVDWNVIRITSELIPDGTAKTINIVATKV